ncbi:putative 2-carboxy-D-arabinitol-1-phosphatase [Cucurbita argyrosperma subsp. argyrosperma]|nr:putative 2-carboxy-D-arabinitol-1-phosphatase [Cucurbita argyrosperma subsp. argyrosperma]
MACGVVSMTIVPLSSSSSYSSCLSYVRKRPLLRSLSVGVHCSSISRDLSLTTERLGNGDAMTGGAFDFYKATTSLTERSISTSKKVTLVRHGLSTWNEESRVQGSSDLSLLTETGVLQAEKCRRALANINFDRCFASPISRAKNLEAVDAKKIYPKEYTTWREDPAKFCVNGVYPLRKIWVTAREAWREILLSPGENFVVVTHKSILRALICTALGLGPERFRSVEINNGGISVFKFNEKGEAMLQSLNMTAHMYSDHTYLY